MLMTGARVGAVLDLTWDRVDFERGTLDFHNPEKPVTKKRRSVVPMNDTVKAALRDARQFATKCGFVIEWNGKPVGSIKTAFKKAAVRAGVPWCSPHVLKHTVISFLAEAGWPVDKIADFTETTAATVRRAYRHTRPENLTGQADTLEAVLYPEGANVILEEC